MTSHLFPPALREKLRPSGAAVPHPGTFAFAPMPSGVDAAIEQFTGACDAVGGRVSRVANTAAAADIVLGYLEAPEWSTAGRPGPAPFVAWDAAHLPLPDVPAFIEARGATRLDATIHPGTEHRAPGTEGQRPAAPDVAAGLVRRSAEGRGRITREPDNGQPATDEQAAREEDYRRLDMAIVGVTGAYAALADTGSVALVHGAGRARLVSLLPPVHVALVSVQRLHATLGAFFAAEPDVLPSAANVVFVTGPSRTADIEMTLTRGVHGPRIVHVVFVG